MIPYASQTKNDGLGQILGRLAVATLVPVFGLFVLRLILASLPMIKNAGTIGDLGVTPLLLVKAALDAVIHFLILRFGFAVSQQLKTLRPQLAEIGTVALLATGAIVATLAYSGYEALASSLAPSYMEIYNWLFLGLVLAPIGGIVMIVTRRMDFFTNLIFGKLTEVNGARQFAAAAAAPAAPAPHPGFTPPADPASEALRNRLQGMEQRVAAAKEVAQKLHAEGRLTSELKESSVKMQGYWNGAIQALSAGDMSGAKGFADWAEYEAARIAAAAGK